MTKKISKMPTLKQAKQIVVQFEKALIAAETAYEKANAAVEVAESNYQDADDFEGFVDNHDDVLKAKKPHLDSRRDEDMSWTFQGKRYVVKRLPGTFWSTGQRNEYGGIIEPLFSSMNPKGVTKTKLPLKLAELWAAGKSITQKTQKQGIDIAKLNQAIAKAGYKVVKQ